MGGFCPEKLTQVLRVGIVLGAVFSGTCGIAAQDFGGFDVVVDTQDFDPAGFSQGQPGQTQRDDFGQSGYLDAEQAAEPVLEERDFLPGTAASPSADFLFSSDLGQDSAEETSALEENPSLTVVNQTARTSSQVTDSMEEKAEKEKQVMNSPSSQENDLAESEPPIMDPGEESSRTEESISPISSPKAQTLLWSLKESPSAPYILVRGTFNFQILSFRTDGREWPWIWKEDKISPAKNLPADAKHLDLAVLIEGKTIKCEHFILSARRDALH